ncbi:MAG: PIN domain-containing protein [Cyanobacteria bacterium J06635_11]
MSKVLVDTSALIAFFVASETHHPAMKAYVMENPALEWVVLSTVLDETVTWLRIKVSVKASIEVGQVLRQEHTYIALSEADDRAIWETFCNYDDKLWSYTDCSLLAMSRRLGVSQVASFDQHIRQMAGLGIVCAP